MRSRLPLILIALALLFALAASGCGSSNSDPKVVEQVAPLDAPAAKNDDIVGPDDGSASESAKPKVDDETSKRIDKAMRDARAQCRKAANNIPNAEARTTALETCAKIK